MFHSTFVLWCLVVQFVSLKRNSVTMSFDLLPDEILEKILIEEMFPRDLHALECDHIGQFSQILVLSSVCQRWRLILQNYIRRKFAPDEILCRELGRRFVDFSGLTIATEDDLSNCIVPSFAQKSSNVIARHTSQYTLHHEETMKSLTGRVFVVPPKSTRCDECNGDLHGFNTIHWHLTTSSPDCQEERTNENFVEDSKTKRLCSEMANLITAQVREDNVPIDVLPDKYTESWSIDKSPCPRGYLSPIRVSLTHDETGDYRFLHIFDGGILSRACTDFATIIIKDSNNGESRKYHEPTFDWKFGFKFTDFIILDTNEQIPRNMISELRPPLVCIIILNSLKRLKSRGNATTLSSKVVSVNNDAKSNNVPLTESNSDSSDDDSFDYYEDMQFNPSDGNFITVSSTALSSDDFCNFTSSSSSSSSSDNYIDYQHGEYFFSDEESFKKYEMVHHVEQIFTSISISSLLNITKPSPNAIWRKNRKVLYSRRFYHSLNRDIKLCLKFRCYPSNMNSLLLYRHSEMTSQTFLDSSEFVPHILLDRTYDSFIFSSFNIYFDLQV